jgi:threonine dehydrogenase-like Zn-dependent dehydrogenase
MIAACLVEPGRYEFREDVPCPEPGPGEILVRSRVATLCGSDFPFFTGKHRVTYPAAPGYPVHETTGEVVASQAPGFGVGDMVLAIPKGDRGFADHFVAEATRSAVLPEWRDDLVLAQPLGCVVKAARRLTSAAGRSVVVIGQGGIGLFWTQLLRSQGASTVIAVDLNDRRLDVAREVGAKDTINPRRDDVAATVRELTGGEGADIVVEAVGENETQALALDVAGFRAEVVLFGVPHQPRLDFPLMRVFRKNLTIVTSTSADAPRDFPDAFRLILDGTVDTGPMVTHRLPYDQLNQAMGMAADGTTAEAVKILLTWP